MRRFEPEETFTELVIKSIQRGKEYDGQFQLQTIRQQTNQQIIGYYHCFHQNP